MPSRRGFPECPAARWAALLILQTAAGWAQTPAAPAEAAPSLPPGLYAIIHTSMGTITAELYERETPNTVRNFIGLARGTRPWLDPQTKKATTRPLYDNITFHRVIPNFMIQTGDPTGTGAHNCGFVLKDEIVRSLKFDRPGRLAMANIGKPDSGGCQFFITEKPFPDGNGMYTIFGQVVAGMELIGQIARVKRDGNDKPKTPVMLTHVDIVRIVEKPVPGHTDTGFGIYVNSGGDVLTAAEAVQDCREVHIEGGAKVEVAAVDRQNGLAVLHSGNKVDAFALFRSGEQVPAQELVWTFSAAPQVVSATADAHGDNRFLQLEGQAGTPGIPVLDTSGNLAGVISGGGGDSGGKLAIKASVATGFLEASGISYKTRASRSAVERVAATDQARRYTVAIQCWK
jgi:peptidyl-prolyl cis-trans isomerase A (cyclophilin A)